MNNYTSQSNRKIILEVEKISHIFNISEIDYVLQDTGTLEFHFANGKIVKQNKSIDSIKNILLENNFIQIGKKIIFNREKLLSVKDNGFDCKIITKNKKVIKINEIFNKIGKSILTN
jgi:DNA-binding LytR/AlgR family response regulator